MWENETDMGDFWVDMKSNMSRMSQYGEETKKENRTEVAVIIPHKIVGGTVARVIHSGFFSTTWLKL